MREKQIFEQVYERDNGCCQVTDIFISKSLARPINFMHILPKGMNKFYKFKLNPDNILFVHDDIHIAFDHGCIKDIVEGLEVGHKWHLIIEKYNSLYKEYSELYPGHGVPFRDYEREIYEYKLKTS